MARKLKQIKRRKKDGRAGFKRGEADRYRLLWLSVIVQAFRDLTLDTTSDKISRGQPKGHRRYIRDEALTWLLHDAESFPTICLFAGYNPEVVREATRRLVATPDWENLLLSASKNHRIPSGINRIGHNLEILRTVMQTAKSSALNTCKCD